MFFFVEKLVNCADFSDIDFEYMDTPGQKSYPTALLIRIIVLGMIYGIILVVNWNVLYVKTMNKKTKQNIIIKK